MEETSKKVRHTEGMLVFMKPISWVIVDNKTGEAIVEIFNEKLVSLINKCRYTAVPILEYLQSINKKLANGNGES